MQLDHGTYEKTNEIRGKQTPHTLWQTNSSPLKIVTKNFLDLPS